MQQLLLHGSDATGKQCTLALPHSKWFRRLRKDGLPNPPIIPLVQFDSCIKTYPELLIAGAGMRRKYETDNVSPNIMIEGKSLGSCASSKL